MAPIEEHDGYDDSIPTPDAVVTDEADPNPEDGGLNDAPPAGINHAEGAVDDAGNMLNADGDVIAPKVVD